MKYKERKVALIVICVLLVFAGLLCSIKISTRGQVKAATLKGIVTADSLNVRKGPNVTYGLVQVNGQNVYLFKDDVVKIQDAEGYFYKVSFEYEGVKVEGYCNRAYIAIINSSTATATPVPTATPVSTATPKATKSPKATATPETITLEENEIPDAAVTVETKLVTGLKYTGKVNASSLRVRKKASILAKQLTYNGVGVSILKNRKVTILREKIVNGVVWYYVKFKYNNVNLKGYVLSDYIALTFNSKVKGKISTDTTVKVRNTPGVSNDYVLHNNKQVTLKDGKSVQILSEARANSKKWFRISFTYKKQKRKGYVLANQILFTKVKATTQITETVVEPTATPEPEVTATPEPEATESPKPNTTTTSFQIEGKVSIGPLNVRVEPGLDKDKVTYNNEVVQLTMGQEVTVLGSASTSSENWYYVSFQYSNAMLKGYVMAQYIDVSSADISSLTKILTDAEFETSLTEQGFPESYKSSLRTLHKQYPLWSFFGYNTNLDWDTVVENESPLGLNLILNTKSIDWKSFETGAYDWSTDTFVVFDGKNWVAPSKAALQYYMDPRNFLTETSVFQFEQLSYVSSQQTVVGVESILVDTPFGNQSFTYTQNDGTSRTITYAQAFIEAAEQSGVNPYHLASRVKQEVVTSKTTASAVATGKVSGYEGYYNFYNIGASISTTGGALAKAASFAKSGASGKSNTTYLIPWNNPYKAIVGGAIYIGTDYISKGQDTLYLEKFNVTDKNTYAHQYMANVEAPVLEAAKSYVAYSAMLDMPMSFSIPIYNNMPESPCIVSGGLKSPNNWLKTLTVINHTLSPGFSVTNTTDVEYNVYVGSNTKNITINATAVSSLATISGTGKKTLSDGNNTFKVTVTADSGESRVYKIHVIRK